MLNAEVKKNIFFARARKYGSAREAALDRTEVPVSVYDNLVQAVHQNMNTDALLYGASQEADAVGRASHV